MLSNRIGYQNPHYLILHYKQTQTNLNKTLKNNNSKVEYSYQNIHKQTSRSRIKSSSNLKTSKKQLIQIPKISNPEMVLSIDFGHNKIIAIPKFIQNLTDIKQINLEFNCISRIDHIFNLKKLQKLHLSHNKISQVPRQIIKLQRIQLIDLSFNNFCFISQIQPLTRLFDIRNQLNSHLYVNLQGNQVFGLSKIIKNNQFCQPKNENTVHKASVMNTSLQDLSLIINNSNKTQYLTKQNQNKIINKKLNINKPEQKLSNKKLQQKLSNNKENENCHNQNISIKKSIINTKIISPTKQSINNNLNKDNENKTSEVKQSPNRKLSQLKCQNQSLLISPNFKQSITIYSSQNPIAKKIINDSQFKNIAQQNKKIVDNFTIINKKFNLLKQFQNIPNNVQTLYLQNTQKVLYQIQQILINFNLEKQNGYIFQSEVLSNYESSFSKILLKHQQSTKTIESNHQFIVNQLANSQNCELHWYKTWLYQYSKFKQIHSLHISNVSKFIRTWSKYLRVSQILNINFQRRNQIQLDKNYKQAVLESVVNTKRIQAGSENKSNQIRLQKLLFSKQKSQFSKESSIKKRSYPSSQKKNCNFQQVKQNFVNKCDGSCFQCLLKDQQLLNLKQQMQKKLTMLQIKNKQNQKQKKEIKLIKQNKQLYQKIQSQQKHIIGQLDRIQPSTYQFILLQQAKAVQSLFNYQNQVQNKNQIKHSIDLSIKKKYEKLNPTDTYKEKTKNTQNAGTTSNNRYSQVSNSTKRFQSSKNKQKKTAHTHQNQHYYVQNQISQFIIPIEEQDQIKTTSKINYFKNTDKYGANSHYKSFIQLKNKTPNQKLQNNIPFQKNDLHCKRQKYNSQNKRMNSQNQELNTNSKKQIQSSKKSFSNLQKEKNKRQINYSNNKRSYSSKNHTNITGKSQNVIENQKQLRSNKNNFAYQSFKTDQFIQKLITNKADQKTEKKNGSLIKSNSSYMSNKKEWPHKNQYAYTQLQLQEKKQYKKYIDYHLRSNIENILRKKHESIYEHEKIKYNIAQVQKLASSSISKSNPTFILKHK